MTEEGLLQELGKFNVHLATDSKPFEKGFLFYLYAYFSVLNPKNENPIYIHRTDEEGSQLVRKKKEEKETHLFFSKNAGDQIITKQFEE